MDNENEVFQNAEDTTTTDTNLPPVEDKPNETYHFFAEESSAADQTDAKKTEPVFDSIDEDNFRQVYKRICEENTAAKKIRRQKRHQFYKKTATCICAAACFGLVAGASFYGIRYGYHKLFPEEPVTTIEDYLPVVDKGTAKVQIAATETGIPGEQDASETVKRVVNQTMPAMVSVKTVYTSTTYFFGETYESEGGGSGIIIGKNDEDLLIATNFHVIDRVSRLSVVLADNSEHEVTVKGSDSQADLAILALPLSSLTEETLGKIDIAVLGDSDHSQIGQMVIAIGNALGYGPSVTVGYLSAKDREVTIGGNPMVLLQTNAAINAGNSGGALLNTNGEVIGINNAKLSSTDIEGICFAIPISKATPILKDLMNRQILPDDEKGYLGVTVRDLDSSTFVDYNWPEGVYVFEVSKGGAAEKAEIFAGDIITHVNGVKVSTTNQLINAVTSNKYGTSIEITLQRQNRGAFEEMKFNVVLQKLSESSDIMNNKKEN